MYLNAEKITFFLKEVKIGKMAEAQNSDDKMMIDEIKKEKKETYRAFMADSFLIRGQGLQP